MPDHPPHPLSADQAEVLLHLLRHDEPGMDALRRQVPGAMVTRYWGEHSVSFDMEVRGGPRAALADGPHADRDWGWTPDGEPEGTFLVWVADGRLSALEYGWVTEDMPTRLPEVSRIRPPRPGE